MLFTRKVCVAMLAVAILVLGQAAWAADDASGTWKWTQPGRNDQPGREITLKLKQEGEKLTGTISGRNNEETAISDGKVKDGEISFKVVRKMQDREFVQTYTGKVTGETIKGKSQFGSGDQARSRDWEAKKAKA